MFGRSGYFKRKGRGKTKLLLEEEERIEVSFTCSECLSHNELDEWVLLGRNGIDGKELGARYHLGSESGPAHPLGCVLREEELDESGIGSVGVPAVEPKGLEKGRLLFERSDVQSD